MPAHCETDAACYDRLYKKPNRRIDRPGYARRAENKVGHTGADRCCGEALERRAAPYAPEELKSRE